MLDNIMLMTDGYKASHWRQYPPKTEVVYSYLESRGGEFDNTVFFGLQYIMQRYLAGQVVDDYKIANAASFMARYLGPGVFNEAGWRHIHIAHNGRLPLVIRALKEGTPVDVHTPLMTVENTCPECYWLTNYVETLLVQVWYPTTVATLSRECKRLILSYLVNNGDETTIPWKLHDFGYRGVSSVESAALGGAAHLVNFRGTDTIAGIELAMTYYMGGNRTGNVGPTIADSIPASEHSTITAWGKDGELDAFRNMLEQYPTGLVACVSDSYDLRTALTSYWGGSLKGMVLNREGTLIVRPDSGRPVESVLVCLERLDEAFGSSVNVKGFRVLNPHVRIIQGDGVDAESIDEILSEMEDSGWSADNVAFGMGGALLQKVNRDTQKFAMKCSWVQVDGQGRAVFKAPIGDPGKRSKAGRFDSEKLHIVFRYGEMMGHQSFEDVRKRAAL